MSDSTIKHDLYRRTLFWPCGSKVMLWLVGSRIHYLLRIGPAKCQYRSVPCVSVYMYYCKSLPGCVYMLHLMSACITTCACVFCFQISLCMCLCMLCLQACTTSCACVYITVHVFGYCNLYMYRPHCMCMCALSVCCYYCMCFCVLLYVYMYHCMYVLERCLYTGITAFPCVCYIQVSLCFSVCVFVGACVGA